MNRVTAFILLTFSMSLCGGIGLYAAESEPAVTLDFEGELIEGEKKGPDLLYQTENVQMQLDDLLYTRHDFNDIHSSDSKKRPRFSTMTRARTPQPAQRSGGGKP